MTRVGADIRCSSLVDKDTANPTDIEVGALVIICALVRFCLLEIIICMDLEPGVISNGAAIARGLC